METVGVTSVYGGSGDPKRGMELLWGTREQPKRGPKPKLTVPRIAAVAVELADAEGIGSLSMRKVAARLGVTAMSLYSYVPAKGELIDVMIDTVLGELPSGEHDGDWRSRLASVARQNWELHLRHPWLMQLASSRPVLGPNLIARYDYELRAVDGVGLSDVEMDLVVGLVANYVHGAVRGAVEVAEGEQRTGKSDEDWWREHEPLLAKVFDDDRYPVAARVGVAAGTEYGAAIDPVRAFEFGLGRVLDGVAVLVERDRGQAADAGSL